MRVDKLATEARTARVTQVEIALKIEPISEPFLGAISSGLRSYSADDVTEAALRNALFGDASETMLLSFGGHVSNPLEGLHSEKLSEEVLRPMLRLLMTETLVGSGRAARLTRLRLSAPVDGRRRMALAWRGLSQVGKPGELREIEGMIQLA